MEDGVDVTLVVGVVCVIVVVLTVVVVVVDDAVVGGDGNVTVVGSVVETVVDRLSVEVFVVDIDGVVVCAVDFNVVFVVVVFGIVVVIGVVDTYGCVVTIKNNAYLSSLYR